MINTQPLIDQTYNRFIEVAGAAKYQCTDLVNYHLRMQSKPLIINRNAIDFKTAPGYTYVKNTASFLPQEGDIAIFNIGTYGDVAVVTKGTNLNDLVVYGQNYPIGAPCRSRTHRNYASVAGFLVLSSEPAKTYTVVSGDTLSEIGTKTGVQWQKIASLNGIKAPYVIHSGQVLKLS